MRATEHVLTAAVVALSAAVVWLAWAITWVERLKAEESGELHVTLIRANLLLVPLAIVLFGLAFTWLRRRRWVRGGVALVPLPAWSLSMLLAENWVANDVWFLIVGLHLQGIDPFGIPS